MSSGNSYSRVGNADRVIKRFFSDGMQRSCKPRAGVCRELVESAEIVQQQKEITSDQISYRPRSALLDNRTLPFLAD